MAAVPKETLVQHLVEAAEAASAGAVGKATMGGAASVFGFGVLSLSEFGMLAGLAVAFCGLLLQILLGLRDDARKQREHVARMANEFSRTWESRPQNPRKADHKSR